MLKWPITTIAIGMGGLMFLMGQPLIAIGWLSALIIIDTMRLK